MKINHQEHHQPTSYAFFSQKKIKRHMHSTIISFFSFSKESILSDYSYIKYDFWFHVCHVIVNIILKYKMIASFKSNSI